ncbi:MAG: LacI family DNA-binding transcriptional regulator, partial [Planctomycetia bacterium]|nr:LacI family DNA-binding transcriptional regulator [Planctomycetia bacterium]
FRSADVSCRFLKEPDELEQAMKNVSIAEIARRCNVSPMTVSRVLRQDPKVREETRQRILSMARELGYFGQSRCGRPRKPCDGAPVIQLLIGSLGGTTPQFHLGLMIEVERLLSAQGYDCLVRFSNGDYEIFTRMLEAAKRTTAERTILIGNFPSGQLEALQSVFPGLLLLDNPGTTTGPPFNSIVFDNKAAARLAVNHLLENGRRRILLLGGEAGHFFTKEMESGYREAFEQANIPVDEKLILHTDFSQDDAARAMDAELQSGTPFDAVFTNDEMAAAVYRVLMQNGKKIPDDIAVCGCDNIPASEQMFPPLTTISLRYDEMARQATDLVCRQSPSCAVRICLLPELIVRRSS